MFPTLIISISFPIREAIKLSPSPSELAAAVGNEASAELSGAAYKIKHCAGQLSDDQLWWRPSSSMNSIGNLILHLCGNVRQWITCGIGGLRDTRDRPREFAEQGPIASDELDPLTSLSRLQRLNLSYTGVDDAGLAKLAALRFLQSLNLSGTPISDDGVQHIAIMSRLETLNLSRTEITDRGVDHLRAMQNLKKLSIHRTRVSSRAEVQLRRVFPELELIGN